MHAQHAAYKGSRRPLCRILSFLFQLSPEAGAPDCRSSPPFRNWWLAQFSAMALPYVGTTWCESEPGFSCPEPNKCNAFGLEVSARTQLLQSLPGGLPGAGRPPCCDLWMHGIAWAARRAVPGPR